MLLKSIVLALLTGVMLVAGGGVLAVEGGLQQMRSEGPSPRDSYVDKKKKSQSQDRNLIVAAKSDGFRDVVIRFYEGEMSSPDLRQERSIDEGAGGGSWFAMLVAGFGVALISIIRRMGSFR